MFSNTEKADMKLLHSSERKADAMFGKPLLLLQTACFIIK